MAIAIGVLKMLLELQESRKTGALDIAGPAARVRLFVEDGRVVYADEGTVGETLGRLLVREKVLDEEQYTAALERMANLRAAGKKAFLGEVFVALGLLTKEQLHAALSAQVQQKVLRALAWSSARFRFIESRGPLELAHRFATPIEPLVVAALRLADRDRVAALLEQGRDRHVALRGDHAPGGGSAKQEALARIEAFRLQPAEDAFARGLDATRTIRELLEGAAPEHVDRAVILAALLLTDVLDLPATASMRGSALPRSVPRPSPSSRALLAATAPVSSRQDADAPLAVGPETPVAKVAPLLAERAYQAGKRLVRANRLADAVKELRRAASLYPAVEYDLWAAWAEARADEGNEDAHADALRAVAELAIEQDTERGFATFVLGHLARRAGENETADALFERARALDPEAIEDAWEAPLRLGPAAAAGTRSEVRSLAPLLTTGEAAGTVQAEAEAEVGRRGDARSDGGMGGVATLRGIAAEAALEDARARGQIQIGGGGQAEAEAEANAEAEADAEANAEAEAEADANAEAEADADANANADAEAEAEADADANANADADADAEAEADADAGREVLARPRGDFGGAVGEVAAEEGTSRGWVVAILVLAAVGGGVFFATRTTTSPDAGDGTAPALPTASAAFTPSTSASVAVDASAAVAAAAPIDAGVESASYASVEADLPAVDPAKGMLSLPASADSHRVYVDGRLAGVPPAPIVVGCGRHVVKIGSQGREQNVVVPCGGSVSLTYP